MVASAATKTLEELQELLRPASVARVGGFRPPDYPVTSWFLQGVGLANEGLPTWQGQPMFPLLQIRTDELPLIPQQLRDTKLLVLFHNLSEFPFDKPHGEGWLIREYESLDGLKLLPVVETPFRSFPIEWEQVSEDAPGWEDAWDLLDLALIQSDEAAETAFFDLPRYSCTKVGGFPTEIQHGVGLDDFVFQVASEEKVRWMWADNGMGYFHRSPAGEWRLSVQSY